MKFTQTSAQTFIPDGVDSETALSRTTHLGIGAHQDDLEFMAFHGILACYDSETNWFSGVTCTNGAGSARSGEYSSYTDEDMQAIRRQEQNKAAELGHYSSMVQLGFPSAIIKNPDDDSLEQDLLTLLQVAKPHSIYTHNPADKHDTHIAVFSATLKALRRLPEDQRPQKVYGCEVWRGLDWMLDTDKIPQNVSGHDDLAQTLNQQFASQIAGGKRYDLATIGRRRANATFFDSHRIDDADQVWYAMDLLPLVENPDLNPCEYVDQYIQRFAHDVQNKMNPFFPKKD